MAAASPVREAFALPAVVAIALVGLLLRAWLRLTASRDEGGKPVELTRLFDPSPLRRLMRPARIGLWLAQPVGLRFAWLVARLKRLPRTRRLALDLRLFALVHARFLASLAFGTVERRALPELLLGCRNQAKIVLGVLVIILGPDRVARGLSIACKLQVLLCNMVGGAPDFHIRTVRFIQPA